MKSCSRQYKPKSQLSQEKLRERDREVQPELFENVHFGKRPRKNNSANSATDPLSQSASKSQQQQQQQTSTSIADNPSIRSSTVIRRVQAVIHVKDEEDAEVMESRAIESYFTAATSGSAKERQKEESAPGPVASRRRLVRRKGAAVLSDNGEGEEGEEEVHEDRYNLRKSSRINYQQDDEDEEEDELAMGAEVRLLFSSIFITQYFAYLIAKS